MRPGSPIEAPIAPTPLPGDGRFRTFWKESGNGRKLFLRKDATSRGLVFARLSNLPESPPD